MGSDTASATSRSVVRAPVTLKVVKGADVIYRGKSARILSIVSPSKIWLRVTGTTDSAWATLGELSGHLGASSSDSAIAIAVQSHSEEDLIRANEWVKCLQQRSADAYLAPQSMTAIAREMEASVRTVARHFQLFLTDPSPQGQLANKPGPEKGASYLRPAVEAIVLKAIDEKYETEQRPDIASIVSDVRKDTTAAGLEPPSASAIYARLCKRDRWKSARKRHGRVRGDAKAAPAGDGLHGLNPLDFVQMDHAILDLIVVDPVTREEIGRPWITLAIDVATRCVLGFYLTWDDPGQTSVALAMEHACCPKEEWLAEIGYKGEWVPMGIMKVIGWDNGKCFKPTSLATACRAAGIEPRYRLVRHPQHGGHIERYIGTYMGQIHLLKGTTFSNTKQREDYPSQKRAVMSLPELIAWTVHQINGVYHNTKHSALGKTPLEAWNAARMQNGRYDIPRIPANRRTFRLSLLPGVFRTVTREGLSRFALRYTDEALFPLIGNKKKYWIAHDPRNISCVYLRLDSDYLDISWLDRQRRPIALFELRQVKRALKLEHDAPANEAKVFEHLEQMRVIETKAEKTTRTERKARQRRPVDDRPDHARAPAPIDYTQAPVMLADPLGVVR